MTKAEKRLLERIKKNVTIDPEFGCWLWERAKNGAGYPRMNVRVKGEVRIFAVTRVVLAITAGEPGERHEAAHKPDKCPFKTCVNPKHLYWATRSENELDKRHPKRIRLPEHRIFPPQGRERTMLEAR